MNFDRFYYFLKNQLSLITSAVISAAKTAIPILAVAEIAGTNQGSGIPSCDSVEPRGYLAASLGSDAPGNCVAIDATIDPAASPTPKMATVF